MCQRMWGKIWGIRYALGGDLGNTENCLQMDLRVVLAFERGTKTVRQELASYCQTCRAKTFVMCSQSIPKKTYRGLRVQGRMDR